MPNYRILRQFSGDRLFRIGEVVSLDGRNIKGLVENRFVEPTEDPATPGAPSAVDGFIIHGTGFVTPPQAPVEAQAAVPSAPPTRGRGRPRKTSPSTQAGDNPTAA